MRVNDQQYGKPEIIYKDTKAAIEALTGVEGQIAYATDSNEFGSFNGTSWDWGTGGTLTDHDHSGDAGDGGTFDAANLTSGAATDGWVLTADGLGGAAWEVATGGAGHDAVTVSDTGTVDLALTGQALSAAVIPGGIKLDDLGAPDDNTDLNASVAKHGLLPKLGGGTTNFLRADGSWAAPPGGSGGASVLEVQVFS